MDEVKDGFSGTYTDESLGWHGGVWGREMYEFTNSPTNPLTFSYGDTLIRPDNHFKYDKKSAPWILTPLAPRWFSKQSNPRASAFHDSGYRHGGHWFGTKGGWEFRKLSRAEVDRWFRVMIPFDDGTKCSAVANWIGVRIGGWASFKKK